MKSLKQKTLLFSSAIMLTFGLSLTAIPTNVSADQDQGLFRATLCSRSGVRCNNCDPGSSNCYDHTCADCRGELKIK